MVRRGNTDGVVVEEHHFAWHIGQQIFCGFVDRFGRKFVLFVGGGVHENPCSALFVEEGGIGFVNIGGFQFVAAFVGSFQNGTAGEVAEFALIERLAFSRFDEVTFDHNERIAVDLNFQTFTKLAGVV